MPPKKPMTSEETIQYLMIVIKHIGESKPNWHGVAQEGGISSANHAQRKFKKIVEQAGFALVNNAVVDATAPTTPVAAATPNTPTASTAQQTPRKKRKVEKIEKEVNENGGSPDEKKDEVGDENGDENSEE